MRMGVVVLVAAALLALLWIAFRASPDDVPPSPPPTDPTGGAPAAANEPAVEPTPEAPVEPARVSGTVKSHADGWPPVVGATVRAWRADATRRPVGESVAEATTDRDGAWAFEVPSPGEYVVLATADAHGLESKPVRAPATGVDLCLRPGPRIDVRVDGPDGEPFPRALVLRKSHHGPVAETVCDDAGRAEIGWTTFDQIAARAPGLGTEFKRRSFPETGPLVLTLRPVYGISGVVVDTDGAPVVAAGIEVKHRGTGPERVRTDVAGRFRIDGLPAAQSLVLVASAQDLAPHSRRVVPGDEELRIVLQPPVSLAGRVLEADGRPAAGAKVELISTAGTLRATTGREGRFIFEELESDVEIRYGSAKSKHGTQVARIRGPVPLDSPLEMRLAAPARSWVVVKVVDLERKPLARVGCSLTGNARTGENGVAAVPFAGPPGTQVFVRFHHVVPDISLRNWTTKLVTVGSPEGAPVVVALPGLTEILVRVVDDAGRNVEGAKVEFLPLHPGGSVTSTRPGHYRVTRGAFYTLNVRAGGFVPVSRFLPEVPEGEIRVVLHRSARVTGRAGAGLRIHYVGSALPKTGSDGSFELEVPPGRVRLQFKDDRGGLRSFVELDLQEGEVRDLGRLPELREREVAGTVIDETGRPLGGATVVLVPAYEERHWAGTPTRADGAFSFRVPAAGEWTLAVGKEGRTGDFRVIPSDDEPGPIRLVCRKGGTVLDVGCHLPDFLVGNAMIRLPGSRALLRWPGPLRRGAYGPDGERTEYLGLPAGRITVVVRGSHRSIEKSADVRPGKTTRLEIDAD